jgi:hypothetical protein
LKEREVRLEGTVRRGRRRKQLLDDYGKERILEIERRSSVLYLVENSLWKMVWTCSKMDNGTKERKKE